MKLAWRNLINDRLRFTVTVIGIAFAVFLMVFQGSLLAGFIRASSRAIDATDADIWISARGVDSFEFATPIPRRFREMALGVPGVAEVHRIAVGFTLLQKPTGTQQMVLLVGAEPGAGSNFPIPYVTGNRGPVLNESLLIDRSNTRALDISATPIGTEVGYNRARTSKIIDGFGSFFGTPYVFTEYNDAARYLGLGREETFFLTVRVAPDQDVQQIKRALQSELPEVDVWTRQEFSRRAELFWIGKT